MRKLAAGAMCVLFTVAYLGETNAQIFGIGAISCGKYLTERSKSNFNFDSMMTSWVQGFVSASNDERLRNRQPVLDLEYETVLPYLDKYCRDKPLSGIAEASFSLVTDLAAQKATAAASPSGNQQK